MIGNHVCGDTVPRVQIPLSPPRFKSVYALHRRFFVISIVFARKVVYNSGSNVIFPNVGSNLIGLGANVLFAFYFLFLKNSVYICEIPYD